jgi:hypothetical protein
VSGATLAVGGRGRFQWPGAVTRNRSRIALCLVAVAVGACDGASGSRRDAETDRDTASRGLAGAPVELSTVARRAAHTASPVPDGSVLIAGGCIVDGCETATAETFVVAADGRSAARGPAMSTARDGHTATTLPDGRIVLIGGFPGEGSSVLASIDVVDASSGRLRAAGQLLQARGGHATAALPDGRLLVAGGWVSPHRYTAKVEIVDPRTWTVTRGPDLPWAGDALDAVTLDDGRVLVTGGQVRPGVATASAAVYEPVTGAWEAADAMTTPRFKHFSLRLDDGRVLVIGGTIDDQRLLATTELFDSATGRFSAGPPMIEPRYKLTGGALVLADAACWSPAAATPSRCSTSTPVCPPCCGGLDGA